MSRDPRRLSLDELYDMTDVLKEDRAVAEWRKNMREVERIKAEYRVVIDEITRRNIARRKRGR
jgi:hypothetical protein